MDNPVSGVQSSPCHHNPLKLGTFPLSPGAALFMPNNSTTLSPLLHRPTAMGMASYYVAEPGVYTVVYYSPKLLDKIVLPDQTIAAPFSGQTYNSDSSAKLAPLAASING